MRSSAQSVHLRCSAAIFRGDAVLLLQRGSGDWALPGGPPAFGEDTAACVVREVRAETGLTIEPVRVAFLLETTNLDYGQHLVDMVYYGVVPDTGAEPQAPTASFVPLDDLARLRLYPSIAGHLRTLAASPAAGAAVYLGNLWRS